MRRKDDVMPLNPLIYEINALAWLNELQEIHSRPISLGNVPPAKWDDLTALGFDAVWLMGVWERSPESKRIALAHPGLLSEFKKIIPDFSSADVAGSPYSVHRYAVDQSLGGPEGLAAAREKLAKRGMRLILDFIPNHTALDHPWVSDRPEFFIRGSEEDLRHSPDSFFKMGNSVFAHGRDPYFPPWTDVAQLNAFSEPFRIEAIRTLKEIARQCDGVRCDMTMLFLNRVFSRTWGERAGPALEAEFWREVIGAMKNEAPDFIFIAEAYWGTEPELLALGFDWCYDKNLYDALCSADAHCVKSRLNCNASNSRQMLRFIENHDEPRAAQIFGKRQKISAISTFAIPGAKLIHHGQMDGRKAKLPVQLKRGPKENADENLKHFYRDFLMEIKEDVFRIGDWRLLEVKGWPDNQSCRNIIAWSWTLDSKRRLIAVNFSKQPSQGRIEIKLPELANVDWLLIDPLNKQKYRRDSVELAGNGLFVDLPGWGFHFFRCAPSPETD